MLPGWNGLWCPNCVWNEVVPAAALGDGNGAVIRDLPASDAGPPAARP